jgi:hypothetical protein
MFEMHQLGDIQWFLGLKVIRDRTKQKIWLSQQAYIERICKRFNIKATGRANTPLPPYADLRPQPDRKASAEEIFGYAARTGSANFAAIVTRPDVAKPLSVLAEYQTNPGPNHLRAADHCLQYLLQTKQLCVCYGRTDNSDPQIQAFQTANPQPEFLAASDASFADDATTRKSSEGWIFSLFGGPIDWKAVKQRTVTKSSTEAELLALSHAGSELIWWNRLFTAVGLRLDTTPVIYCDNRQTLRIVTGAKPLKTSLRHVDIHNHWLRQEHANDSIRFEWIDSANMPADGLTKLLPGQKHATFIKLLNLQEAPSS